MKISFKTLAAMCAVSVGLTGCTKPDPASESAASSPTESATDKQLAAEGIQPETEEKILNSVNCRIVFSDEGITHEGNGVEIYGNTVTINNAGVYHLSGKSSDVKIMINAEKKDVKLLLDGVELTSKSGSVIDCEAAKLLTVCTVGGTVNTLSDTSNYTFPDGDDEPDATVFSRSDTIISGSGKLTVNGNYKDAIKCKDGLSISCENGGLTLNAADDGITGKDYVVIYNGDISVTAANDGIKSTNTTDETLGYISIANGNISIDSQHDGIQAEKWLAVTNGNIKIKAGGDEANAEIKAENGNPFDRDFRNHFTDRNAAAQTQNTTAADTTAEEVSDSCKGIKAGGDITISGGEFDVLSADDSLHSNTSVRIDGGTFRLSSCDDGIHADESIAINGGTVNIVKSYEGLEGKNITITNGKIDLVAVDDGINAGGGDNAEAFGFGAASDEYYVSVSGGEITMNANGDGLDSNGTVAQSGGTIIIYGPTNSGNGAIDYQRSYALSGGTLIALGSQGMAQAPSALSQPCLSINSNVKAGSVIEVRDSSGKAILSTTTPKACQSLIFSSKDIVSGSEYSIYADDTLLSTVTATDGVTGGGANGNGFGGENGGFGGRFNRDENMPVPPEGSEFPEGMTPPEGFVKPDKGRFDWNTESSENSESSSAT